MLSYFHTFGHFLYAKSAHLYLQDMLYLKRNMEESALEKFINGFFTIRRTNKFSSSTWTDMIIEQSLIKSIKTDGDVARGKALKKVYSANGYMVCMRPILYVKALKNFAIFHWTLQISMFMREILVSNEMMLMFKK